MKTNAGSFRLIDECANFSDGAKESKFFTASLEKFPARFQIVSVNRIRGDMDRFSGGHCSAKSVRVEKTRVGPDHLWRFVLKGHMGQLKWFEQGRESAETCLIARRPHDRQLRLQEFRDDERREQRADSIPQTCLRSHDEPSAGALWH